jgi:hypothetical protein
MKGVLLFAFNSPTVNYVDMAIATAKRINHFLNLPVTLVTDNAFDSTYKFDKVVIAPAETSNTKNNEIWINKGRYRAYDLSPYNETIVLDTDYLVNSDMLLKVFDMYDDFMCPNKTRFILQPDSPQEQISPTGPNTLWATVIAFRKTNKMKQLFECLEMVQKNYFHYIHVYNMQNSMYRNDYGLTIANNIVNGHVEDERNYIPWPLTHVNDSIRVFKNTDNIFNTSYTMIREIDTPQKTRNEYTLVKDTDFHLMNKKMFMEIV